MKLFSIGAPVGIAAAAALIASGCGGTSTGYGGGSAAAAAAPTSAKAATSIAVRQTKLGKVLVDAHGRTLYLFEADKGGTSACSGGCASIWPPLTSGAAPTGRGGTVSAKIATIAAAGGKRQVTYAGHPLYSYAGDNKPGDTAGQGLNQFGAKWYVLGPSGRKIDDD